VVKQLYYVKHAQRMMFSGHMVCKT